jgi:hypothetical protein
MNRTIIEGMINNSTWTNPDNNKIYKFSNGRELAINGKNHLQYSLQSLENKTVLNLENQGLFYVDYINDFNLKLYNDTEIFSLTPY